MKQCICTLFFSHFFFQFLLAQDIWSGSTYPDEAGYQQRIAPMMQRIAAQSFAEKSKAFSRCPDTGMPVRSWAVEGDTIISPYTGRKYVQGPTGYFGPKERNEKGEIIKFGGDPLKRDLPPALAYLLLHPDDPEAKAYLSIPGNLNQQYHFAAKNWARFYPMLSEQMGEAWQADFQQAVANYGERRRPSDGVERQYAPLSVKHDLVGEKGELLGGNKKDGGTENHKTMWRTSGLLYAQLFPENSLISGYSIEETESQISFFLKDYLKRMLTMGNGEYDSQIYYPHSIEAYLNLYDFSPDPATRQLAKLTLDYYLATYGLKVYDGAIAGAQKRGNQQVNYASEMRKHLYAWFGVSHAEKKSEDLYSSIHQITSSYRPNQLIWNLVHKNIDLPFEAEIARPFYHMDVPNQFQEYFYASRNFGIGSVYMTRVDNPNQQVIWSLVVKGEEGPMTFGGLQPYHRAPGGHSPYTQTLQKENVIIVASATTQMSQGKVTEEQASRRYSFASADLQNLPAPSPEELGEFFGNAKYQSATWLFVPRQATQVLEQDGRIFIDADSAYLAVSPTAADYYWLEAEEQHVRATAKVDNRAEILYDNKILVVPGQFSGYALEVAEKNSYRSLQDFARQVSEKSRMEVDEQAKQIFYTSASGPELEMHYQAEGLRCRGFINGQALDFDQWAGGGAYQSPYIISGKRKMMLSDGEKAYTIDFTSDQPKVREERIP
jgi:hypothetical protein